MMGSGKKQQRPRVVVLGGGYAGSRIARSLSNNRSIEVVLIDQREHHIHKLACLRAVVDEDWRGATQVPRNNLLTRGRVLVGNVVDVIEGDENADLMVVLEDKRVVPCQFLVCATGAQNICPGEPPQHLKTAEEIAEYQLDVAKKIKGANRITIVGGGVVGIEMAGEILSKYPNKSVVIVHSGPRLMHTSMIQFTEKFHRKLAKEVRNIGAKVKLNARVDLDQVFPDDSTVASGRRVLELSTGEQLETDLVLKCVGLKFNSTMLPERWLDEKGQVKVDSFLRSKENPRVFASGDITNTEEEKMFMYSQLQVPVVVKNILRAVKGKEPKKEYKTWFKPTAALFLVPMGTRRGVTFTPLGTFGAKFTSTIKGKHLLKERMFRDLGEKCPKDSSHLMANKRPDSPEMPQEGSDRQLKVYSPVSEMLDEATLNI